MDSFRLFPNMPLLFVKEKIVDPIEVLEVIQKPLF